MKREELYNRLIELSKKVLEGKIDPLEINLKRYLEQLEVLIDEIRNTGDLLKDSKALHGLITILYNQYKILKTRGLGLYLEPILIQLRVQQLTIKEISDLIRSIWTPTVEIEQVNNALLELATTYYITFKKFIEEKSELKMEVKMKNLAKEDFVIPLSIREKLNKLFNELLQESKGNWIDYYSFIHKVGESCVERAYLLSFLITDGKVDFIYKKFENKAYIRPSRRAPKKFHSVVIQLEEVRSNGE